MNHKDTYLPSIRKAINYIENNLKRNLPLNEIAAEACYSEFHFHRIFTGVTGHTLKDYIRKRRLSEAAKELISTDKPIRDLAYDYCFSKHESFTRAFQNFFFINPHSYRHVGVKTGIVEKMDIGDTVNLYAGKEICGPTVISMPTRYFIGMKFTGTNNNIDIFFLTYAFLKRKYEIKNRTGENDYGFDTYRFDRFGNKVYDFYFAAPVTSLRDVPNGMVGVEIPPADYAVVKYKGNSAYLYSGENKESVYTYIYNTLLPQCGLHFRDGEYKLQSDNSYQAVESDFTKIIIPISD